MGIRAQIELTASILQAVASRSGPPIGNFSRIAIYIGGYFPGLPLQRGRGSAHFTPNRLHVFRLA